MLIECVHCDATIDVSVEEEAASRGWTGIVEPSEPVFRRVGLQTLPVTWGICPECGDLQVD
jgi:hypothetical protein